MNSVMASSNLHNGWSIMVQFAKWKANFNPLAYANAMTTLSKIRNHRPAPTTSDCSPDCSYFNCYRSLLSTPLSLFQISSNGHFENILDNKVSLKALISSPLRMIRCKLIKIEISLLFRHPSRCVLVILRSNLSARSSSSVIMRVSN